MQPSNTHFALSRPVSIPPCPEVIENTAAIGCFPKTFQRRGPKLGSRVDEGLRN